MKFLILGCSRRGFGSLLFRRAETTSSENLCCCTNDFGVFGIWIIEAIDLLNVDIRRTIYPRSRGTKVGRVYVAPMRFRDGVLLPYMRLLQLHTSMYNKYENRGGL